MNLQGIVARLSETESKALAQAVHNGGTAARESFKAMYGAEMPNLEPWTYHRKDTSLLLMFGDYLAGCFVVSEALSESLQRIIPEPAVSVVDAIPEIYQPAKSGWRQPEPRPVRIFESSETTPLELRSVLQLVKSGRLSVTEKSLRPTEASVRLIAQCLVAPDFDAELPDRMESRRQEAIGRTPGAF